MKAAHCFRKKKGRNGGKGCRLTLSVRNLNVSFEDKILSNIKGYWEKL